MKTELAKDTERAGAMIQYDAQCKKVLSNKYILAWIMQAAISENMMNTLLSPDIDIELKKKILWNEYQITMEKGFVKEMSLMCNLSEWVYDCGIQRGIQTGIREIAVNLLKQGALSEELILEATGITKEEFDEIKEELMCIA